MILPVSWTRFPGQNFFGRFLGEEYEKAGPDVGPAWFHVNRAAGGDRDHRRAGSSPASGGADSPRGGPAFPVPQQPQANRACHHNHESASGSVLAVPATVYVDGASLFARILPFFEQGAKFNVRGLSCCALRATLFRRGRANEGPSLPSKTRNAGSFCQSGRSCHDSER